MIVPNIFSLIASVLVLYLFFRKSIPKKYDILDLKKPADAIRDPKMFRLSWFILGILLIGYFGSELINIPFSFVAGTVAVFFLIISRRSSTVNTKQIITGAPWAIVFFSIGMYVVVYGLRNVGLTSLLAH